MFSPTSETCRPYLGVRRGTVAAALALTACNGPTASARQNFVECFVDGSYQRICLVEQDQGPDGVVLTLRHPDGRFRRLLVARDGRGVIAADGAEQAVVTVTGEKQIDVALGGDRYRLPATVAAR